MVLVYSMTAILTLFCNILLSPNAQHAQDDLVLLGNIPELIRSIHMRQTTAKAVEFKQRSGDMLAEMARLGAVAIQRQREPQGLYAET